MKLEIVLRIKCHANSVKTQNKSTEIINVVISKKIIGDKNSHRVEKPRPTFTLYNQNIKSNHISQKMLLTFVISKITQNTG